MADNPQSTPSKGVSSKLAWSEQDKVAYLLVLCEHSAGSANFESKTSTCPVPAGRTAESCRKIIRRLKDKHSDEIKKIKAGQPLNATHEEGSITPKTPTKRKKNVEIDAGDEESPKKKTAGRKASNTIVKEESIGEEQYEV